MDGYSNRSSELARLADKAKKLIRKGQFPEAEAEIRRYMSLCPDSAVPHNLYGILCEARGEHSRAMSHFRAAMSLEPTDRASAYNLELFGTSCEGRRPAYSEKDLGIFRQIADKIISWNQAI